MRSRILRFCTAIVLTAAALPFFAATVAAQDRTCFTPQGNFHTGRDVGHPTKQFDRIVADIDVNITEGLFSVCDATPTDFDDNGPITYVSIQPGLGNAQYGNEDAIFQVGVTSCASFGNGVCDGDGTLSYFWAYGGCNGARPTLRDLGPASATWHEFKVAEGSASWYVYIDGVAKSSIPKNHSSVSCWINGDNEGGYFGEKWDKGDSLGDASTWNVGWTTRFDNMAYSYVDDANFIHINGAQANCYVEDTARDFCSHSGDVMSLWTDQP